MPNDVLLDNDWTITYGTLEDWSLWLADRDQSPKSRRLYLGYFRSFMGWLHRRASFERSLNSRR